MRQIRETNPFNIYGRIVYKSKKGSSYYYQLLAYKHNKTLLWEKSRIALERDWEKVNINITIEISQYENIIRSVLNETSQLSETIHAETFQEQSLL